MNIYISFVLAFNYSNNGRVLVVYFVSVKCKLLVYGTVFKQTCASRVRLILTVFSENCPQYMCPNDAKIPESCRKPQFVIGADGQSKCRVCDSNMCGMLNM